MKSNVVRPDEINAPHLLLINPWIHDFAAYNLWSRPMGLLYLASVLRGIGYRISYLDCLDTFHPDLKGEGLRPVRQGAWGTGKFPKQRIPTPAALKDVPRPYHRYGVTPRIFRRDLGKISNPDAVLVTSIMTYWYPGVVEAVKIVRDIFPAVPVILGGIYAGLCQEHAQKTVAPDYLIKGPGEMVLPKLLAELTGGPVSAPQNWSSPESANMTAFDLCRESAFIPILTSRGCPRRCPYCAAGLIYPGFSRRNSEFVVDEMEYWFKLKGTRDVAFYDDALLVDFSSHLGPMLEMVLTRGLPLRFHTPNGLHTRYIDKESAKLMRRAGFRTLRLSLETSDASLQQLLGNKTDNEAFANAVKYLAEAGFSKEELGVYLLVGLPGQGLKEIQESVNFVMELGLKPNLAEYSPIPGTPMWDQARQASRYPLENDPIYHNNSALPCADESFGFAELRSERKRIRDRLCSEAIRPSYNQLTNFS